CIARGHVPRFSLRKLPPAGERKNFLAVAKADKIVTAILAAPFVSPEQELETHPEWWSKVLSGPDVQIHPETVRTSSGKHVLQIERGSDEPRLAVQTPQWTDEAKLVE